MADSMTYHLHAWAPCPICRAVFRLDAKDGESYSTERVANHMVASHADHPTMTAATFGVPYITVPVPVRLPVTARALDRALVGIEPISDDDDVEAVDELLHRIAYTLVPPSDDGSVVAAVVAAIEALLSAPSYHSVVSGRTPGDYKNALRAVLSITFDGLRQDAQQDRYVKKGGGA